MSDLASISSRLNRLELEYKMAMRNKEEKAERAYKALSNISDCDVELLKGIAPALPIIKTFTIDDIMKDKNGEIDMIRSTMSSLKEYLENRLSFYEEQL